MLNISLRSAILLSTLASSLQAANVTKPSDPFDDLPVVLSDNTLQKNRTIAPLATSIIDRQMIEASGARTIPDTLRLIPGMVVGHSSNEFGDKPLLVVAYHGQSDQFSRRMNVLIDGRSIYGPLEGGVDWYNIPIALDDIERIEVTRGPNASTFGSNSFQAVVNIVTRNATEDQGYYTKVNVGSNGIVDASYRIGGGEGDLNYSITLATVNDDGQNRADKSDAFDGVNAGKLNYRMDYQVNANNKITYTGSYGNTNQETEATTRPATQPKSPRRVIKDTSAHQLIRWDSTINSKQSFILKYFFNYQHEDDKFNSLPINLMQEGAVPSLIGIVTTPNEFDDLILSFDKTVTSKTHNIEFSHFINPSPSSEFTWGFSAQQDNVSSIYHLNPDGKETRNIYHLFGSAVYNFNNNHSIDIGLLYEKSDGAKKDFSPRFTYLYHLNNNHTYRVGISQAVRTPFILEQSGQTFFSAELFVGGTGTGFVLKDFFLAAENVLETEKITSVEVGYSGKYLKNTLSINARIFRDELSDLLDADFLPTTAIPDFNGQAFIYENILKSISHGFELEVDFKPKNSSRLLANIALIDISSDVDPLLASPSVLVSSVDLTESAPDLSVSILAIQKLNNQFTGSMGYYYASDFSFTDVNNASPNNNINLGGYRKLDIRISRLFKIGSESISTSLIFQNMLGDYSDYDAIPNSPAAVIVQNQIIYFEAKMKLR